MKRSNALTNPPLRNARPRRNRLTTSVQMLICAVALALPASNASADPINWTGFSGLTNGWSDVDNWWPAQVPSVGNSVIFDNTGAAAEIGVVNNVVDADITIDNLSHRAIFIDGDPLNVHSTRINPGVTLSISSASSNLITIGGSFGTRDRVYATILGEGTLAVGSLVAPVTTNDIVISLKSPTTGAGDHMATLDMADLDNFTFGGGRILVAADGGAGGSVHDRPAGTLILAKTNVITAVSGSGAGAFMIGNNSVGNGSLLGAFMELGQENTINTDYLKVGGSKLTTLATFRSGLENPTLRLRGKDGSSRMLQLNVADNFENPAGTQPSTATFNLSGGTVDALVTTMRIGRHSSSSANRGAVANMTFTAGVIDVTTLTIGSQVNNNIANVTGTLNVLSNAVLVASTVSIGRDGGTATGTGTGTLNIEHGGQVIVTNNILEDNAAGHNGNSTITLNNGTLDVGGRISVDTLNYGGGTITNYSILSLSALNISAPATEFTVHAGQRLAAVETNVVGTLTVNGSLTLNAAALHFLMTAFSGNDVIHVTDTLTLNGTNIVNLSFTGILPSGSYVLATCGTLVGDANNLQIAGALASSRYNFTFDTSSTPNTIILTVGPPPASIVWSGDGIANTWDVNGANNWDGQTQPFYDLDTVTFSDSGSTTPAVNLVGTLRPTSVTVNSANNYTFSGSGKISSGGLTKLGSGTLSILNANDYTGATAVSGGTLLVNGGLGNTALTVSSGAMLGGNGTLLGSVTVQSGATLSPGAPVGSLTISNNLTLAAGSTSRLEVNLDTLAHDAITGLNNVAYGGTLIVTNIGGTAGLADGATLNLFSAVGYSGTFATLDVPALPVGWTWDISGLPNGTLMLARTVSTTPTHLNFQVTGSVLDISWPSSHTGWRLEAQTNAVGVGLTDNWITLVGTQSTNRFVTDIDPANGSVFYRLVYP
jgi:autotransporter-associated beta strand protein